MRFLVDENLPQRLADLLNKVGHDAVHVRDLEAAGSSDAYVISLALEDDRVIISADTNFGALLAHNRATKPSVILVRAIVDRRPAEMAALLDANLGILTEHLERGASVALTYPSTSDDTARPTSPPWPAAEPVVRSLRVPSRLRRAGSRASPRRRVGSV